MCISKVYRISSSSFVCRFVCLHGYQSNSFVISFTYSIFLIIHSMTKSMWTPGVTITPICEHIIRIWYRMSLHSGASQVPFTVLKSSMVYQVLPGSTFKPWTQPHWSPLGWTGMPTALVAEWAQIQKLVERLCRWLEVIITGKGD